MHGDIAANAAILRRLFEIEKPLVIHNVTLREIHRKIRPLLEPPSLPLKRGQMPARASSLPRSFLCSSSTTLNPQLSTFGTLFIHCDNVTVFNY